MFLPSNSILIAFALFIQVYMISIASSSSPSSLVLRATYRDFIAGPCYFGSSKNSLFCPAGLLMSANASFEGHIDFEPASNDKVLNTYQFSCTKPYASGFPITVEIGTHECLIMSNPMISQKMKMENNINKVFSARIG